jgi:hypothetical protein
MKLHRIATFSLLAFAPALVHCEIHEVQQQPAAPQPPQPPAPPEQPVAQPAPPQDDQGAAPQADSYDDQDPSAVTDFHTTLDPYGQWVDDPTYGTIWVPNAAVVGPGFTPYQTAGHWSYDNDYVWESDYPWGWAPFHYGRWVNVGNGWGWIPGRAYRGAWVSWGADDGYGYAGWYPSPPAFVWRGGVAVGWSGPVIAPRWSYVARGELFSPTVGARVITGPAAVSIAARVHAYTPVAGRPAGGPPPSSFGFHENQVPHPSPTNVGKAQQFAHPSTAAAMGGHAPAVTGRQNPHGFANPGSGGQEHLQGHENTHAVGGAGEADHGGPPGQQPNVQGHENPHGVTADRGGGPPPGQQPNVQGHENPHPVNMQNGPPPQRQAPVVQNRGGGGRGNTGNHHK